MELSITKYTTSVFVPSSEWDYLQEQIIRSRNLCNNMLDEIQNRGQFPAVTGIELHEWLDQMIRELRAKLDDLIMPF